MAEEHRTPEDVDEDSLTRDTAKHQQIGGTVQKGYEAAQPPERQGDGDPGPQQQESPDDSNTEEPG